MPIYEFNCPIHGRFEQYFPLSSFDDIKNGIHCVKSINKDGDACLHIAEKVWSQVVYPSHAAPTIVFRNKQTGETEVALYKNQQPPAGFIKEELRTPHERSKFEREETAKQRIEDEYRTEERRFNVDYVRKQRHDDINARMSSITKDSDNPAAAEALLKEAMKRTRNKKIPDKRTDMKLAVNHQDASNLDKG